MSYEGTFSRGLLANAGKSPMKYRNDQKAKIKMINPFLASRQKVFGEQRDQDQGISTALAAPSAEMMDTGTGGDIEWDEPRHDGDESMIVDDTNPIDSVAFDQLYDGDLTWITPELVSSTVPQKDTSKKVKTPREAPKAPEVAEERFRNWEKLLPSLHEPYSRYKSRSLGEMNAVERPDRLHGGCKRGECMIEGLRRVTCLFMEGWSDSRRRRPALTYPKASKLLRLAPVPVGVKVWHIRSSRMDYFQCPQKSQHWQYQFANSIFTGHYFHVTEMLFMHSLEL
jgi:hypothetical protein